MRFVWVLVFAVVLAALPFATTAEAWSRIDPPMMWRTLPTSYVVNQNAAGGAHGGPGLIPAVEALNAALTRWNRAGSEWRGRRGTNVSTHARYNGVNEIVWDRTWDPAFSAEALAVTLATSHVGTGTVRTAAEADILFNGDRYTWATGRGVLRTAPGSAGYSMLHVMVHELGHSLGLGHSGAAMAIMFPFAHNGTTLHADDLTGVRAVYPAGADLCTSDTQCPTVGGTHACISGSCTPVRCGDGIISRGEVCDDGSANGSTVCGCRADCTYAPSSTSCRGAAGSCDVTDYCTGSGTCNADARKPRGTSCRPSRGACDVAEVCDGTSRGCPSDRYASSTTQCRSGSGSCNPAEFCTGSSHLCPLYRVASRGTVCRPSAGACDTEEVCDGSSRSCPTNRYANSRTECRAASGSCDVAELCTGSSASCPSNAVAASGTMCRTSTGACDVAEVCNGTSRNCPANRYASSSTECRAASGSCDVAEACTGSSASCPSDVMAENGTICRAGSGACDIAEACNGTSRSCPSDEFAGASVECRPAANQCDRAEFCGGNRDCPRDSNVENGTPCADGVTCNGAELCASGECVAPRASRPLDCDDGNVCTADACAEPGGCENTPILGCCTVDTQCPSAGTCMRAVCDATSNTCSAEAISGCCPEGMDCADGGVPTDAGVPLDAGAPSDAGAPFDGGSVGPPDADLGDGDVEPDSAMGEGVWDADSGILDSPDSGLDPVTGGCECSSTEASPLTHAWLWFFVGLFLCWRNRRAIR